MKRSITIALCTAWALLAGIAAQAQQNRISIGVAHVALRKSVAGDPYQKSERREDIRNLMPTIGFYRQLRGSFGLGLELGYAAQRETVSDQSLDWGPFPSIFETAVSYREFYICPSVFETFGAANRKYRFIASLSLPLSFSPDYSKEIRYRNAIDIDQLTGKQTDPLGTRLHAGLFLGGSVQRRIAGSLYFCPQVAVGGVYSRIHKEGTRVDINPYQNPPLNRTEQTIRQTETELRFEIRPSLALNFYF